MTSSIKVTFPGRRCAIVFHAVLRRPRGALWRVILPVFNWHCPHSMRNFCLCLCRNPFVSVPFASRTPQVCCCRPGDQETSIDCCTAGDQQQRRRSAARSSKCGECYVVSWRRKLNTDLFQDKIGICVLCGKCHQSH